LPITIERERGVGHELTQINVVRAASPHRPTIGRM
jgi:hypothetical protein